MPAPQNPRRVAILVYEGVQSLDVTGPLEVFTGADSALSARAQADRSRRARGYEVTVVGPAPP